MFESTKAPGYVKTGEDAVNKDGSRTWAAAFASWSNKVTFIPGVGALLALPLGAIGTAIETLDYLLQFKFGSAATAAVAGAASTATNTIVSGSGIGSVLWWGNAGQGLMTGRTAGSHVRMGTEKIIGSVFGAIGMKPNVLQDQYALNRPGQFTTMVANQRGQDANAYYAQKMSGEAGTYVSPTLTGPTARA